jgi:catechol 2,3-dioxygenase-like lactoylglutathione lyase family enzyme
VKHAVVVTSVLCGMVVSGNLPQAKEKSLPFGMATSHPNLVLSVSDADKVHEFYGEVLGLERIADIPLPGNMSMIRYLGGESEMKFIVTNRDLPTEGGGADKACGIRLLALFLPADNKPGILERLKNKGYVVPQFQAGGQSEYGMTSDAEGNQVELVFYADGTSAERFKKFQIGLTTSDAAGMTEFLGQVLGLPKVGEFDAPGGIHVDYYGVGNSQVKFWSAPKGFPVWVGTPLERKGMSLVQFLVPDVDAVRTTILERGGHIHTEPFTLGHLATIMFVDGPDGILFEFAGPVKAAAQ